MNKAWFRIRIATISGPKSNQLFLVSTLKTFLSRKFHENSTTTFLIILLTDRQTDGQTNKPTNKQIQTLNLLAGEKISLCNFRLIGHAVTPTTFCSFVVKIFRFFVTLLDCVNCNNNNYAVHCIYSCFRESTMLSSYSPISTSTS